MRCVLVLLALLAAVRAQQLLDVCAAASAYQPPTEATAYRFHERHVYATQALIRKMPFNADGTGARMTYLEWGKRDETFYDTKHHLYLNGFSDSILRYQAVTLQRGSFCQTNMYSDCNSGQNLVAALNACDFGLDGSVLDANLNQKVEWGKRPGSRRFVVVFMSQEPLIWTSDVARIKASLDKLRARDIEVYLVLFAQPKSNALASLVPPGYFISTDQATWSNTNIPALLAGPPAPPPPVATPKPAPLPTPPPPPPVDLCVADVVFVVDRSQSINADVWKNVKKFVTSVSAAVKNARISVATFGSAATKWLQAGEVGGVLDALPRVQSNDVGLGIKNGLVAFSSRDPNRANVRQVMVVVTDGKMAGGLKGKQGLFVTAQAAAARSSGVTLIAVGTGKVDAKVLTQLDAKFIKPSAASVNDLVTRVTAPCASNSAPVSSGSAVAAVRNALQPQ